MIHKFPFTEINFQVRPDLLDVNVHPTKMELKFANSQDIYSFTYNAIRETLLFKELIPDVAPGKDSKPETYKQRNVGDAPEAFENKRREALVGPVAQAKAAPTHMVTDNSLVKSENAPVLDQRQMKPERASTSESQARPEGTSTALQQPLKPDNIPAPVRPIIDVIDETKDTNTSAEKKSDNNTYEQPQKSGYSYSGRHQEIPGSKVAESKASYMAVDDRKYVQQNMFQEKFLTKEARAKHRLIGQLFKTYWLIEYDGKFFIMDQHAAHEKVKYEELMENYKNKKIYSQYLMPPAVVTLSATEIEFLHENMETFEALGYQIENFGGREFKLNAVPDNLFGLDGRELFIDFIADASSSAKKVTIDVFIHKLSTMACKAAIKGNTEISFKEADALIDQLLKLENPYTCPHGRPTVISMTEAEIEKKFKRIV